MYLTFCLVVMRLRNPGPPRRLPGQLTRHLSLPFSIMTPMSFVCLRSRATLSYFCLLAFTVALSNGTLYSADFSTQKAANSTPIDWEVVGNPSFTTTGYSPVMALAQNHIHFLNVPGLSAGQADIFVIHCESRIIKWSSRAYRHLNQSRTSNPRCRLTQPAVVIRSLPHMDRLRRSSWPRE